MGIDIIEYFVPRRFNKPFRKFSFYNCSSLGRIINGERELETRHLIGNRVIIGGEICKTKKYLIKKI